MSCTFWQTKVSKRFLKSDECNGILDKIATKLHDGNLKPRSILNTLSLVEFLLKNGSPRFKLEINEDLFFIKKLRNFYDQNDEEDLGRSIQTIVQRILSLLENQEELKIAKEEAKRLRNRIQGFSNEGENGSGNGPNESVGSKYKGISSDSYQNEGVSGNREVNLAQKLGLESKVKIDESESKNEVRVITNKKEPEIDFLGFSNQGSNLVKQNSAEPDFLNSGQGKAKGGLKFLPPPPKKNQNKVNSVKGQTNGEQNVQIINETNLDFDFQTLNLNANQDAVNSIPDSGLNQNIDSINLTIPVKKNSGLIDFDFTASSNLPTVTNSQPKQDFDFGFENSTARNTSVDQNELDMFDFTSSAKNRDEFQGKASGEIKAKSVSKLPVPPKKNVVSTKESSDFLF